MKIIALFLIAVLLTFNTAQAEIKFIPKEGKLWVEASGQVDLLKSSDNKAQYFILKLEDKNIYILSGQSAGQLRKFVGKQTGISGLLKARIDFEKKSIPSIEVRRIKEITPRAEK